MTPDLYPIPFTVLVDRLDRELASGGAVYELPRRAWWTPDPDRDISFEHFGHRIASPGGPASGPHTQLAQNLVVAWLAGARFMELKTVQVLDELEIPRPCIYAPHVGYNVEWSQELRVPQSADEYVKGWLLMHMLTSEHGPGPWTDPGCMYDVSVGYDLAGLRTEKVRGFLDTMRDASAAMSRLRAELPPSLAKWAAVECPSRLADSVTLSTFHGCPADEIEAIAQQTLEWGWSTVVKLNPTLLGYDKVREMLDHMGYEGVELRRKDFDHDLKWDQLTDFIPRLKALAADRGLGFGVKFSNTLVCESDEPPFTQKEMYLSGPPLHVLAITLAARFRAEHPDLPITFSAGIDKANFAGVVGAGIGPVTSCTDLLKGRGYARMRDYLVGLEKTMKAQNASNLAALRATADTVDELAEAAIDDERYHRIKQKAPKKVGSTLALLDCLTCDKCIPVCPNIANFRVDVPIGEHRPGKVRWTGGKFERSEGRPVIVAKKHQIGNVADACNLCGHCDAWCPEDGGPYLAKPTVFLSEASFTGMSDRDGMWVVPDRTAIHWRTEGQTYIYRTGSPARLEVDGGAVLLDGDVPTGTEGEGEIDLAVAVTLRLYLEALCAPDAAVWTARSAG